MTGTLTGSVDRARSGVASGTLNSSRQAGSVLGVAVFGSLVAQDARFTTGFHIALLISLGLIVIGVVVASTIADERNAGAETRRQPVTRVVSSARGR
jgi:DHA2 family methylenomycin A resistance protein-like MFS transporter